VVGVKWTQAQAFVNGELKKNSYIIKQRTGWICCFRLPTKQNGNIQQEVV
jgi:hypothetical protein